MTWFLKKLTKKESDYIDTKIEFDKSLDDVYEWFLEEMAENNPILTRVTFATVLEHGYLMKEDGVPWDEVQQWISRTTLATSGKTREEIIEYLKSRLRKGEDDV